MDPGTVLARVTIHVKRPTDHPGLTVEELEALYAELPTVDCQCKCFGACASIGIAAAEFDRIAAAIGYTPRSDDSGWCPLLDRQSGLCTVHQIRPMICRLWGVSECMQCPWGCEVTPRKLTEAEVYTYLFRSGAYGPPRSKEEAEELVARAVALGQIGEPVLPGYNVGLQVHS